MDREYIVQDVFVLNYMPKFNKNEITHRNSSVFVYIKNGDFHYINDHIDFYAKTGDVLYIPKGASYSYTVDSKQTERIQVEFNIKSRAENTDVAFDENPAVVSDINFSLLFCELFNNYCEDNEFMVLARLYEIISLFIKKHISSKNTFASFERLSPAISYIKQNLNKKIYVEELSKICSVSETHLRRLFNKHLGMSPTEYRKELLLQSACTLIKSQEMNISEIADALGFGDIYSFSRFFKKMKGVSPGKYKGQI